MKKNILIGLAILAVSTSAASAAHKTHAMKPKAAAAAATPVAAWGQPSAADRALYMKSQRESGMMKKH
jgi:hypothetical protein